MLLIIAFEAVYIQMLAIEKYLFLWKEPLHSLDFLTTV